jgi:hypothetical protein
MPLNTSEVKEVRRRPLATALITTLPRVLLQMLVDEGDRHAALAGSRGNAFHRVQAPPGGCRHARQRLPSAVESPQTTGFTKRA